MTTSSMDLKQNISARSGGETASKTADGLVKTHEMVIAGMPFRIRSTHDETTVRLLVEMIDGKVREGLRATKSGSFQSAAILAALNVAEELIMLKRQALKEINSLDEKIARVSQDLELILEN